jgi:hypothetical protein
MAWLGSAWLGTATAQVTGYSGAAPGQNEVRGLSFDVYIRLQTSMSEGELLLRAGKPDSESVENFRYDIVKTYYYFPTVAHPWMTAVTPRGGRISNIERTKKIF